MLFRRAAGLLERNLLSLRRPKWHSRMNIKGNIRIYFVIQSFCILIGIFLLVDVPIIFNKHQPPDTSKAELNNFHECISETTRTASINISDLNNYVYVWNLCNKQIYEVLSNDDFSIRREKYREQELDERVNLWLVVSITLSGVILSGIQLLISYKLAVAGKEGWSNDTQFAIEQGRMSFRSSITGLVILALSLLFFIVYVKWIYSVQEIGQSLTSPVPMAGPTLAHQPEAGGIGARPDVKVSGHPLDTLQTVVAPPAQ